MITGLYASILALFFIYLAAQVIRLRLKHQVGIGDGNIPDLHQAIRVHANFAEYIPLAIILLLVAEFNQLNGWIIHLFGMAIVLSRVLHMIGLSKTVGKSTGRQFGMLLIFSCIVILSVINISLFIF